MTTDFPWRRLAKCANTDIDTDLFFPGSGNLGTDAKAVCAGCPVKKACLAEAKADLHLMGVWGGTTHQERIRAAGYVGWNAGLSLTNQCPEVVGVPRELPDEWKNLPAGRLRVRAKARAKKDPAMRHAIGNA